MMGLNVDVAGHLLQGAEHLQPVRIHGGVAGSEREVLVDLLKAIEGGVENCQAAFENSTVAEILNVSRVNCIRKLTDFGTGSVTWFTFSVFSLKYFKISNIFLQVRLMIRDLKSDKLCCA